MSGIWCICISAMYNQVAIILVAPQLGQNIGAIARIMKNFKQSELRIVAPRDGWPNPQAEFTSVGAIDVIQNAKIYDDLETAIADINYLYATTAQVRDMNKSYTTVRDLGPHYSTTRGRVGIMFGRENCGLNNDEIAKANSIITIDTDPEFSSLNISHAVGIVCYELFDHRTREDLGNTQDLATKEDLELFFDHLFDELNKTGFFKTPDRYKHMSRNIRNIFSRIDSLSHNEVQTLRGVIVALAEWDAI